MAADSTELLRGKVTGCVIRYPGGSWLHTMQAKNSNTGEKRNGLCVLIVSDLLGSITVEAHTDFLTSIYQRLIVLFLPVLIIVHVRIFMN